MKRYSVFMLVALAMMVMAATVAAVVPNVISYQGRLTTPAGTPVPDGSYTVVFTIYDAATGGVGKWTETQSVTTSSGLFSVPLGSVSPISDTVFSGSTRYLGITVGTDPELTPRVALVAVPYAHRVSTVDGAAGGTILGSTIITNPVAGFGNVLSLSSNATTANLDFIPQTNGTGVVNVNTVGSLAFAIANNRHMTIANDGNIGIGTATPWDKLHVAGAIRADQFRGPLVVNGGNITYAADGGEHIFTAGTIERMHVSSATGDAAIILPTDAISSTEIINEPAVARNSNVGFTLTVSQTSSFQDIMLINVTIPKAGYIYLEGSFDLVLEGGRGAYVGITEQAGVVQSTSYSQNGNSNTVRWPIRVSQIFWKDSGAYTFRLAGMCTTVAGFSACWPQITATYFSTSCGSVVFSSNIPTGDDGESTAVQMGLSGETTTVYVSDLRELELKAAEAEAERLQLQVLEKKLKQQGVSDK